MRTILLPLALTVILVAWLTAAATAVRSVSHIWLRRWVERQLGGSALAETYLARPHRLVLAAGAGVTLTVVLAGMILGATPGLSPWQLVSGTIALALGMLVAGQLLPRAIARRWAPRLIPVLLPPLQVAAFVLDPFLRAARHVAALVSPHRGPDHAHHEDIEDLLREGELEGIGEPEEIEIIAGVVQFGEKVLRDVMTPRTEVFAVEAELPPAEMARAIAQSGYSRVPVYRGSLDEIVGMVHVFDVLKGGGERLPPIRPVPHAPVTKRCSEMLFEMLREQQHLAVVLDEFGGTAGIVTLEDLLEELVGDIRDEHDEPAAPVPSPASRAVVLDASIPLQDVARHLALELPAEVTDRAQSLGGVIVRAIGRIPSVGERFRIGELELTVVEAEPTRVRRLLVQRGETARPLELRPVR